MDKMIRWLLDGDISVQYQTRRDLLHEDAAVLQPLRERIAYDGFGAWLLSCRNPDGHWGIHYYQTKWTCTHYTLLDLKNLGLSPAVRACREMAERTLEECMLSNGGMNLCKYDHPSDMGISGMVMDYAAYFAKGHPRIPRLLDYILAHQKADGGFHWEEASATGEPHTTICVLDGLGEFLATGLPHRREEAEGAVQRGAEFLLGNGLFMHSGDKRFLMLNYPYRYRYDVLRALEFFVSCGLPFDRRIAPALQWLKDKRTPDSRWVLENAYKGKVHLVMEKRGEPSRWMTLKALTILDRYGRESRKGASDALST